MHTVAQVLIQQVHIAVGNKIEELIEANKSITEADEDLRSFFDQLYLDLNNFERSETVRLEVLPQIKDLDHKLCRVVFH